MFKKKKLFIILILLTIFFYNFDKIRSFARSTLPHGFKVQVKEIFFGKKYMDELNYYRKLGYNQKKIPQTQFENISLTKITLSNLDTLDRTHYGNVKGISSNVKKFFIENYQNYLVIVTVKGQVKLLKNYSKDEIVKLDTNLKKLEVYDVLDVVIINDKLFISFTSRDQQNDQCSLINIANTNMNLNFLNFEIFYKSDECTKGTNALGGRMKYYNHENIDGLLLTTAASDNEKERAQNDESFHGKIWFFSLDGKEKLIFSKGHRNPQGLIVDNGTILSTEHGPYGGDEINKIEFKENYGFPISSYGDTYAFKDILNSRSNYIFKKNHSKFYFKEPIYSFVPSIGISEIEKIPNSFSKYWENNYFVSSLNGRTLYRIEFDDDYEKIKYMEPIRIDERIRDIKYIHEIKSFALALEETGSVGFIKAKKD